MTTHDRSARMWRVGGAVAVGIIASTASAEALAGPVDEDAVAFLDNDVIDEIVAASENGSADCATLSAVMLIGFAVGFASMGEDNELGEFAGELIFASGAPVLVPLLGRATPPAAPELATAMGIVRGELAGSIGELQEHGFTDEQLVAMQRAWAVDLAEGVELDIQSASAAGSTPGSAPAADPFAEFEDEFDALVGYDFESITFLDDDGPLAALAEDDASDVPWASSCPETAAMLDFGIDAVDIEVDMNLTIGGSTPAVEMEVTVDGSVVTTA